MKQMVWFVEEVLRIEEHYEDVSKGNPAAPDEMLVLGREEKKQSKYDDWKDYFMSLCFKLPKETVVYFCVDALDRLVKEGHVEKWGRVAKEFQSIYNIILRNLKELNKELGY